MSTRNSGEDVEDMVEDVISTTSPLEDEDTGGERTRAVVEATPHSATTKPSTPDRPAEPMLGWYRRSGHTSG